MKEFCHNIKPFPQPIPYINPAGDCFACALTATLQFLFPENPPEFLKVWSYFLGDDGDLSNSWIGMRMALYRASNDYDIEIAVDIVKPEYDIERSSHPWWYFKPGLKYIQRLEGWLRAGWVAFSEIDDVGRGCYLQNGDLNSTNHFIVIDGIRSYLIDVIENGKLLGSREEYAIHIVNSSRNREHSYWIGLGDFIHKHGGAGWWLCRRS